MEKRDQPLGLVMPGGQQTLREQTLGKESPAAIPDAWIVVIMPHLHRSQSDGCH
jgi:hypothetical protein